MNHIIQKYKILSECYSNPEFKERVYLGIINENKDFNLPFDFFSEMINEEYYNFLNEYSDYLDNYFNEGWHPFKKTNHDKKEVVARAKKVKEIRKFRKKKEKREDKEKGGIHRNTRSTLQNVNSITNDVKDITSGVKNVGKKVAIGGAVAGGALVAGKMIKGISTRQRDKKLKMKFREWVRRKPKQRINVTFQQWKDLGCPDK